MVGKNKCDKCGQYVPFENDVAIVESYIVGKKSHAAAMLGILGIAFRHFLKNGAHCPVCGEPYTHIITAQYFP